jgi:hypothetical protein
MKENLLREVVKLSLQILCGDVWINVPYILNEERMKINSSTEGSELILSGAFTPTFQGGIWRRRSIKSFPEEGGESF